VQKIKSTYYYPFGSPMQTRTWSSGVYRFGFNGKEKDDEVNVDGGSYDYGARIYDNRLGRWLNIDPHLNKYPYFSPFNFVANSPLIIIDPSGADIVYIDEPGSPNRLKAEAAVKLVEKQNPTLYNLMMSARVYNNQLVLENDPNYKKGVDITVNISIDDLDGKIAKVEEREDPSATIGANSTWRAGKESHVNGVTQPELTLKGTKDYDDVTGNFSIDMNAQGLPNSDSRVEYAPLKIDVNNDRADVFNIQMLQKYSVINMPTIYNIKLDDYQNSNINGNFQEDLLGETVSHEFGHVKGILENLVKSIYYGNLKTENQNGHNKYDPSGNEADKQTKEYNK